MSINQYRFIKSLSITSILLKDFVASIKKKYLMNKLNIEWKKFQNHRQRKILIKYDEKNIYRMIIISNNIYRFFNVEWLNNKRFHSTTKSFTHVFRNEIDIFWTIWTWNSKMTIIASMSFFVSHKYRKKSLKKMRSWSLTRRISTTISKNLENNVNLLTRFSFWRIQFHHSSYFSMMKSMN